jgi:glycosyltransferase involved in cell wall biosynthesis
VLKVIPNAKLLVIGDGELKEELIKTCIYLSISQNVIFTGFRKDVNRIIEEIDLLVLSSLGEGFGLVCLEAMAMGKPIVASNVMAIPEIVVNGETGILTSPKNSHSLAEGIMKLLRDPDLARKMGEKGKKRLEKQFTIEKMTRKTEELYNDMIKEKSGGKKM